MSTPEKLEKFKVEVVKLLPNYDMSRWTDNELQKWINAREGDVDGAVDQFIRHIEFRKLHKLDEGFFQDHVQPEVLKNYYPGGICGYCKDGYIVKYEMPGKLDVKGLLMSVSDEEFLNHAIYMAESLLDGVNKRSKETGQCLDKWTVVIDAEGFSVKQMTKNVLERQKIITKIFEDNYPDRLASTYIVNCSRLFKLLLNVMKVTMDPSTFSKITVLTSKDQIADYIDREQLPARYGGLIKEDGLCDGGKIPEKFYQVERLLNSTKSWPRFDVKAGTEESVEIEVKGDSMYLSWEFYTVKNRITFSVFYQPNKDPSTQRQTVISPYKPECCLCPETGSLDCQTPGTGIYTLVFGNMTSKLKSKTVVYSVQVLEKAHDS
ncbi:SEC14-like protein 2 [Symsagittifera roscoffensis]|uniref:SEC14-like protein 2 n=1 Tax=Symsagittifera roscoffensis TaxID=84072 RepID=UPI00307C0973